MLRRVLAASDIAAVTLGWTVALAVLATRGAPIVHARMLLGWLLAAIVVTVIALSREQLYLARIWAVRAVEVQRLGRACLISTALLAGVDHLVDGPLTWPVVGTGGVVSCALLVVSRSVFQARLHRTGCHRSLLLTGDADQGARVLAMLRARPELGYQVIGVVAARRPTGAFDIPWLGTPADLAVLTQLTAATGVVVVGNTFEPAELNDILRDLDPLDVHVHLVSCGPADTPQVRLLPLSHRSLAVARNDPALSTLQLVVKRTFDLVAGIALTVVAMPVVAIAAALLKLSTGGPVLVRDVRLGPRGEPVIVPRLRTRHLPDTRLAALVGTGCRRLCIDELPQLGSVLAGTMSLVGPRPHPRGRSAGCSSTSVDMSAGMIGLRHVEARDHPQLGSHRRCAEFYIENWSVGLDLSIIAAAVGDVAWRTLRRVLRHDGSGPAVISGP